MLSQLKHLSSETDSGYAMDHELQFMKDYVESFSLRLQTYQKLQAVESILVQQVYDKLKQHQGLPLHLAGEDLSHKWKQDTIRVLRYSAVAMLMDDPATLRERFLLWFQTIMRSFGAQQNCNITYGIVLEVVKDHLTTSQANLFCPILEINRQYLSGES